jgi:hypothetical protein
MISILWAGSFLLQAAVRDYNPPAAIHGLMTIVATAAFGSTLLQRKDGGTVDEAAD